MPRGKQNQKKGKKTKPNKNKTSLYLKHGFSKREEKYIKLLFKISSLTFTNISNILLVKKNICCFLYSFDINKLKN